MSSDAKTQLKELADCGKIPTVQYSTRREGGTEHEPGWVSEAYLHGYGYATGVGNSKVAAEQSAAASLLQKYNLPLN